MFFEWGLDKQSAVSPYNGLVLSNEKERAVAITQVKLKRVMLRERKARFKKLHNVWLDLYDILEKAKL